MRTHHLIAIVAAALLAGAAAAQEEPAPPAPDLSDPSIFRIDPPSSGIAVAGVYTYTSPFDGQERRVEIRESGDGFWKYTGQPVGGGETAVKLDPSTGPGGYQGEAGPALDPCLAERTQIDRAYVFETRISMVLHVPYVPTTERPVRKDCEQAAIVYRLIPRGGGKTTVRLTPTDEVLNERDTIRAGAPGEPMSEAGDNIDYPRVPHAEARFSLNAPKVPAGTPVRVDRVGTDGRGRTWYHVVTEPEPGQESAEGGEDDPADGWVRPEQVVGRVSYTLHRE